MDTSPLYCVELTDKGRYGRDSGVYEKQLSANGKLRPLTTSSSMSAEAGPYLVAFHRPTA